MIPYLSEIYGPQGLIPDMTLNWTYGVFPSLFALFDGPYVALTLHVMIILAGLSLAGGYFPRSSALILWYIQTSLYNRNNLTDDPSMAYVGLLLLTLALIPKQPRLLDKQTESLEIPYFVFFMPVTVFCITFFASAVDKILSTSWANGTALYEMLHLGIVRDNVFVRTLVQHPMITMLLSYLAVVSQAVCLPLLLVGKYRWGLVISFLSFSFIFLVLDLNQVIYGMLFFYTFFLLAKKN
jgi:hypothetical protein